MRLPKGHPAKAFELHGVEFTSKTGNQLVGICPFSDRPDKFYVNEKNLLWDSKITGQSGNLQGFLKEIAKRNQGDFDEAARKRLSRDRGLPVAAFEDWGIGYDGLRYTIPVYRADGKLVDLRHYRLTRKGVRSTNGCKPGLLGIEGTRSAHPNTPIFICEGEWDAIAFRYLARKVGRTFQVLGAPGAALFRDEWVETFTNRDVYLCYDNDDAGAEGELRAGQKLDRVARSVHFLRFPTESADGADVRDWVCDFLSQRKPRKGMRLFLDLFVTEPRNVPDEAEESESTSAYKKPATFEQVSNAFNKWLYLDNTDGVRVALATVLSNRIDGDPIWMFLVAPPGGSKTETVRSFDTCGEAYVTSSLTAHSLISGMNFRNGMDPSLIPKLDGKVLCIKDFTSILSLRDNEKDEIFGIFRDAYDGSCGKTFGNGVTRRYESRFSILAAVTPVIYSEGNKHTSLGERFLKFSLADNLRHISEDDIITKAITNVNAESNMKAELTDVVSSFMKAPLDRVPIIPGGILKTIVALARLGARMRATVQRDKFRPDIVEGKPSAEVGSRLGKQLAKLAISLAAVERRTKVVDADLTIVKKVVIDTVPQRVEDVVRFMWTTCPDPDDAKTTREISEGTKYPLATCTRLLQNFLLLEIVQRVGGKRKFEWQLTKYMRNAIEEAEIYGEADTASRERIRYKRKARKATGNSKSDS